MSADDLEYNPFYRLLQERFRHKYEKALSKRWAICIPCSNALRGVDISEKFVDVHLLQSSDDTSRIFKSTDDKGTYAFEMEGEYVKLLAAPVPILESYRVKIVERETAYNKDFENYSLMIIDKPLSPEFKAKPSDEDRSLMEKDITSLDEAMQFFANFLHPHGDSWVASLSNSVECLIPAVLPGVSLEEVCALVHETIAAQWNNLLRPHSLKHQRDARFQGLLSAAIEIYIVSHLHDYIFPVMVTSLAEEDKKIYLKTKEFYDLGVTADQFGAPEAFAVPVPAAVVELASIDCFTSPVEKLTCLRTTMDLIMAETKGAIVDAHCVLPSPGNEPWTPPLQPSPSDLIPLIMYALVQAKPLHLATNFFYMENLQWTLEPNNALSHSLVAFKTAAQELLLTSISELLPKSKKIIRELSLEDLIKVTGVVDGRFNRDGDRKEVTEEERGAFSPLDRQLEHLTSMIEASTRELDEEESLTPEIVPSSNNTSGGLIAVFQNNFGTCLSKQERD